jgi:DNA-binding winged helix-turn-helix (wHTH) protein
MFGLASTYIEMKELSKAKEHLSLLTQLVNPNDLTHLARQVQAKNEEVEKLETEAPEIRLVEGSERLLYTPAGEKVDLKKQFVLVNLLKLLGEKREESLSKEEMVNRLWKEDYHPLRHDNKVHATILRLRKLIEPDLKTPQFILNAQDGYRLNPKIHFTVQGGEL